MIYAEERPLKIRALVVDDEPLARSNLTVLLRLDPEIGVVKECGSGMEALAEIRSSKPDLVFLDVQMPECDGFDVLEMLGRNLPPAVVFVTAYDQYALRAFEAGALDYLLKAGRIGVHSRVHFHKRFASMIELRRNNGVSSR